MTASTWYDPSIQPTAVLMDGPAANQDDDDALDAWLASMSVGQFEWIMNYLMDRLGGMPSTLDRPVA